MRHIAVGGDQVVIDVGGVGCGVTDALDTIDVGDGADQPPERPFAAGRGTVIVIDVLAQQRDLARAQRRQIAGLSQHICRRP